MIPAVPESNGDTTSYKKSPRASVRLSVRSSARSSIISALQRGCLQNISDAANRELSKGFYKFTKVTVSKPINTILVVIFCCLVFTSGMARFNLETDTERLFAPQNSQAAKDRAFIQALPALKDSSTTVAVFVVAREGGNILTEDDILSLFDLHDQIVELETDGSTYSKQCAISPTHGECAKSGILGYWNWNRTQFEQDPDIYSTLSQAAPDCCSLLGASNIQLESVAGGLSFAEATGSVTGAEAFRLVWHLTTDAQGDAGRKEVEARMLETLRGLESQSMVFYPWSFLAEIEEAEAAVIGDIPFMITATVLLGVYTCIMMTRRHPVQSQGHMGAVGVFGVGLSIMAGFGLVMAIGTPFSLACNSVIFLTLGLGIDDDFVILEAVHSENPRRDGIPKAMARAMSVAGVSITLTSVTDCVTFLIGSTTVIPALSTFSIYAAVVIFVDFLVQVTLYPACVALDLQRQEENRLDTLCCYAVPADSNDFFCFKNVHEKAPEPYLNTFFGEVVPKLIFHPLGKVFVLLSAVGLLVGGIYGASQLEVEFDPKWMVPSTSYISGAYHAEDTYFSTKYRSVKIYTRTAPEGYAAAQDDLQSLLDDCRALEFTVASSIDHNWYESYISWLQLASAGTNLSGLDPITSKPLTEEAFVGNLKTFLNSTSGSHFQDAIVFEDSTIVATRIPQLWLLEDSKSSTGVDYMLAQRAAIAQYKDSLDPFIFQTMFMHYEGFVVLEAETLRNVMAACGCIFLLCLVVLANAHAAFMVLLTVGMVDVCLLGSLYWTGNYLNVITAMNLLISIGLCVDYSAHVCHAFLNAQGKSREERARGALRHIGGAVVNGGVSSFVAMLIGLAATHYIFRVWTHMFMLIVGLGLYFGMIVLPVLLTLAGPATANMDLDESRRSSFGALRRLSQQVRLSLARVPPARRDDHATATHKGPAARKGPAAGAAGAGGVLRRFSQQVRRASLTGEPPMRRDDHATATRKEDGPARAKWAHDMYRAPSTRALLAWSRGGGGGDQEETKASTVANQQQGAAGIQNSSSASRSTGKGSSFDPSEI